MNKYKKGSLCFPKGTLIINAFPNIAREWHLTKNKNLELNKITFGSNKKVWWQCLKDKKHIWEMKVNNRTFLGQNCPFCAKQRVCKEICLAIRFPEIAKEWHPTLNGPETPNTVIAGSKKKKYWWQCSKNKKHIWDATLDGRTSDKKTGCPFCANKRVCEDNCLDKTHPEIAKEWHPTLNKKLTSHDVVSGSHHKIYWQCLKNKEHVWRTTPDKRTNRGQGCPKCKKSHGEKKIAKCLKKNNIIYKEQKTFDDCRNSNTNRKLIFDFYVYGNNLLIEYDGEFHYGDTRFDNSDKLMKKTQYRDAIKTQYAKDKNIKLIRIPYWDFDNIEKILKKELSL